MSAAGAAFPVDERGIARSCGLGNIAGTILMPAGVMHSDGISSQWQLDPYPGLRAKHPTLVAGVLFRDFARQRDDATVVVLKDRVRAIS